MSEKYRYDQRGVSATKDEVHQAIKHLDKGIFPNAFCKILPDIAAGDPEYCNIMHADTAGTKTSLAYLYWRETGDLSVWEGIAQDALVMNLDDMACVGCVGPILISSTIGRNKQYIPGEVLSALIEATSRVAAHLESFGVPIHLTGGETADVGDIVRTIDVGYTAFARMKRSEVIDIRIQAGDVVVGLASFGQTVYESSYNGGMGSNGLSSARHDIFSKIYAGKYPESFEPQTPSDLVYCGGKQVTDLIDTPAGAIPAGKLVLSPTRTYLPFLKPFVEAHRRQIHGLIHCTGGGQTKALKFLTENLRIVKDHLFPVPPLFRLIQSESGSSWQEMYQVFNMGHRMELYVPEGVAQEAIQLAQSLGIDAQVIGRVEEAERKEVVIKGPFGQFTYC
ncbi:MAG: phosphoribosylformylglycinamidine cyclo-ligase [Haliscomenobacter sp.]|nr:phosphoribosylformylglycinamidine cyclo-ligase [Haliscomenobacter sp.]MBP9077519.1 phosphoribosylformylglycinamidine cyclo-ligase [Haliscomenobacter sp.]MBP9872615.1 phosphoribosylformylglycinamidine cyclo-ligase [Haliscomenobacter sp.]